MQDNISEVYQVQGLKQNLISVSQIIKNGYRAYFNDNIFIIHKRYPSENLIAIVGMTKTRMFHLTMTNVIQPHPPPK